MINFIVCDDNKVIKDNVVTIIDKIMMKNKLAYKTHSFLDYDNSFIRIINQPLPCKIYILDIETPSQSGIDVARIIRDVDSQSIIVFLTSHDELGYTILKNEFMFLAFICKYDEYEAKLTSVIKKAVAIIGKKQVIKFEDHGVIYTIPIDDILYITRDSVDRKCIIKTHYTEFKVNKTLTELLSMVDDRFKQSHRACIINMDRVRIFNNKKNIVVFDNGETVDLISKSFKKEVKGSVS